MSTFDQNDLIAYHMLELPPQRERALRRALRIDAELASESAAIAQTLRAFPKHEAVLPLDADTLDRYWRALRPSLAAHTPPTFAPRSILQRWYLATFAGVAIAAATILIALHPHPHLQTEKIAVIETPSQTIPTLSLSSQPNAILLSSKPGEPASESPPRGQTWPLAHTPIPSPPIEASTNFLPSLPFALMTPAEPSATATTISPTESAASLPSDTSPLRSSGQSIKSYAPPAIRRPYGTDLSLAIFGGLTNTTSSTSTSGTGSSLVTDSHLQTASPAVGALLSFHQQIRPWLGYRVTTAYSRPTFEYTSRTGTSSSGVIINSQIYELSATYVVQGPHRGRLSTSAEAGASLLAFLPPPNQYATSAFRSAAVVGVGAEYYLTKRLSLLAEYRAQIYKAPDFNYTGSAVPLTTNMTFTSNPVVGITYYFGAKRDE